MNTISFGLKRFVMSRFLGALSDQFLLFVVPLAIFKSTGDVKYSGLAFVIEWLPRILFFPLAGFFVDRMKARHLFFGVEFGRAMVLVAALAFIAGGARPFIVLAVMMAVLSVAYILNFVGTEAVLPRNLDAADLPKAQAMLQGVDQVTMVLGPALAGAVSVWGGLNPILMAGAAMFGLSALLLLGLNTRPVAQADGQFSMAGLALSNRTAFKVLMENKVLFHLSALTWVVNLIYGAALVVSASVVLKVFALPEAYFGVLQVGAAITSLAAFAVVPSLARRYGLPTLGVVCFWAMILSGLVLALSGQFPLYAAGYAALMAFDGGFSVYIRSVRAQIIPREHMGKTTGLIGLMNMCSIPMSAAAVAMLSAYFTPFGIFGIIFAVAAVLGIALVWFGRSAFGYRTWLPSAPALTSL
jgi:MFS family permease